MTKLTIIDIAELVGIFTGRKDVKPKRSKDEAVRFLLSSLEARVGKKLFDQYKQSVLDAENKNVAKHLIKLITDEADANMKTATTAKIKPQGDTPMPSTPETTPKTAPVAPAPAEPAEAGRKGRKPTLAGKKLTATTVGNDRRVGSHGFKSFQIILDNPAITVEDFIAKGGRSVDLNWDMKLGRVKAD